MIPQEALIQKQKALEDYAASLRAGVDPGIVKTQDALNMSRASLGGRATDLLAGVGARYGDPSMVSAGMDQASFETPKLARASDTILLQRRSADFRRAFNMSFNVYFDKFIQSGADLQAAKEGARQLAYDDAQRIADANIANQNRAYQEQKSKIAQQFGQTRTDIENSQTNTDLTAPYTEAFMRGLFGLGGDYLTAKKMGLFKTKTPTNTTLSTSRQPTQPPTAGTNWPSDTAGEFAGTSVPWKNPYE